MKHPVRWLLVFLVATLLLTGVTVWRMHEHADAVLARHTKEVSQGFDALLAEDVDRPAFEAWPAARPETERELDARVVWQEAWEAVAGIPDAEKEELPENRYDDLDEIDEAEVAAFLHRLQAVFDRLEDARYAQRITMDPTLADGLGATGDGVARVQDLHRLLEGRYRHALVEADHAAALEAVRQQLLLGSDLRSMGGFIHYLVGAGTIEVALAHLRVLLAQDALDEGQLAAVAEDLDRVAAIPVSLERIWHREDLSIRLMLIQIAEGAETLEHAIGPTAGYQHLFSEKLLVADLLDGLPKVAALTEGLDAMAWPDAVRHLQALADVEPKSAAEALNRMVLIVWPRLAQRAGLVAADLELARLATALARHRKAEGAWPRTLGTLVPTYLDALRPCPLALLPHGYEKGTVWSGGGDGDDDGGKALDEDASWDADGDRVWDLTDKTIPDPFEHLR